MYAYYRQDDALFFDHCGRGGAPRFKTYGGVSCFQPTHQYHHFNYSPQYYGQQQHLYGSYGHRYHQPASAASSSSWCDDFYAKAAQRFQSPPPSRTALAPYLRGWRSTASWSSPAVKDLSVRTTTVASLPPSHAPSTASIKSATLPRSHGFSPAVASRPSSTAGAVGSPSRGRRPSMPRWGFDDRGSPSPRLSVTSDAVVSVTGEGGGGGSGSGFDERVRVKTRSWLRELERELEELGKPTRLLPEAVDAATAYGREEMEARITAAVNGLKAECRLDERLYVLCGDLVHARIALGEAPFDAWLTSKQLGLRQDVAANIRQERALVEMTIVRFGEERFHALRRLGLQSALKYDEVYLARLEDGRKESLGQFFARLAAAAATEAMATPQFAAAISHGCPRWSTCFSTFFWALAHQTFVPATPCMLSTGREDRASASCYLLDPRCDSVDAAVTAVVEEIAPLLRARGGIGVSMQRVNGKWGVMPALKLLDSLVAATNVDCIRATGVCVYLEPWHLDVISALTMRGMLAPEESRRCDNLYLGLWACDLLFKRFERYLGGDKDAVWTLFDGESAGRLASLHGDEFEREYERLEAEGRGGASMPVRDFMYAVVRAAVSTGSPFVLFKDSFNRHFHSDTQGDALACSNLCTEIVQKTGPGESGVCNLVSVNLTRFVQRARAGERPRFDYMGLRNAVRVATVFVNAVCASGKKPTESTAIGEAKHRSIGVGLQGLHTTLLEMDLDLADPDARELNRRVAELMLLETMTVSCEFCEAGLPPFDGFADSRYARGWMHFDGWDNVRPTEPQQWDALRSRVAVSGLYNSQFVALMPTAASAQVTEVSEGFSPNFSNLFSKVTSTGELPKPNYQLMRDLRCIYGDDEAGRAAAVRALDAAGWSVEAALGGRPECASLAKYKTAFEYDQRLLIDLCRDRAPFVDQSQSMTLFVTETADGTLPASRVANLLMHAYRCGLKTGMYYCKIRKATNNGVFAGAGDIVCSACVV